MMTSKLTSLLAAALVAGILALGAASPAGAEDIDAISGNPSDGQTADNRVRFDYRLSPGQSIEDYYLAKNTGSTPQELTVFATDAFNSDDGGFALLDTAEEPVDAGSWVRFADNATKVELSLAPGQSAVVPFFLTVPDDATPGDHAGGLVISVKSAEGQVIVDRRVATRLYIRVPGDLQPVLSITNVVAAYTGQLNPFTGTTDITATITNSGNVALGGAVVARVQGIFGIGLGELVRAEVKELLPGTTRTVTFQVNGVGQWLYLNPSVELVPTIDAAALDPGPLVTQKRDTILFVVPWWLLAILVVAGAVVLFIRIRNRRDERTAQAWIAYTEEQARQSAKDEGGELVASGAGKDGAGDGSR